MVKRLIGFIGLAAVAGVMAGIGCSSSGGTSTTDGGGATPDATATATATGDASKPKTDGGGGDGGGGSCYAEGDALAMDGKPPVKQPGFCTDALITAADKQCLDSAATDAGCTAWINANKNCARCIFGALDGEDEKNTPVPVLIPVSEDSIAPNVSACAALVLGKPDCALKLTISDVCIESACSVCDTDANYDACVKEAQTKICKDVYDAACAKTVEDGKSQWSAICDGTNFDDTYPKVAKYMCGGTAPADAGGGG